MEVAVVQEVLMLTVLLMGVAVVAQYQQVQPVLLLVPVVLLNHLLQLLACME
jgi:hypothetical protein